MAKRDMATTAARADRMIPKGYDLTLTEVEELLRRVRALDREESLQAIITAYHYGFVMGNRATVGGKVGKM